MATVIVDNFDSFTWNLAQQVGAIEGIDPVVVGNDISWEELTRLAPTRVILSAGPGHPATPRDFGICRRIIEELDVPILGVCLGHQGICAAFGAEVLAAREPVHGRSSLIAHNRDVLFAGIESPFPAIRYHSLEARHLPDVLDCIASTADGVVMAVRHRTRPLWGVQFHPESVLTPSGPRILKNFLMLGRPRLFTRCVPLETSAPDLFRGLFADDSEAFWLDSSLATTAARFSYMGSGQPAAQARTFAEIETESAASRTATDPALPFPFQGGWVGYLGYEAKTALGSPSRHAAATPDVRFLYAERYLALDHQARQLWMVFRTVDEAAAECWFHATERAITGLRGCSSPDKSLAIENLEFAVPEACYRIKIAACLERIRAGESYEICLTNQLRGATTADPLAYYEVLRAQNPAPYAAFLRFADFQVACSSPELFLSLSSAGHVVSKPMKGTAARAAPPAADAETREQLRHDEKTRAENLMIVDLTRNDLGRVCQTGTVRVTKLMDIESYATVHQMVSTVEGQLRSRAGAIDCLRAAFPPGSMTGAPKLRTMEIIDELETCARGVYSGSIGYLSLDGAAMFNVVIRTAVFADGAVSIGTGGAVVAQSEAAAEWNELLLKTTALVSAFTCRAEAAKADQPV